MSTVKSPIVSAAGQVVMTVGIIRDITEYLQAQANTQTAQDACTQISKDRFERFKEDLTRKTNDN